MDLIEPYRFDNKGIPRHALQQGTWWRDKTGKLYKVANMSPTHARNASRKLFQAMPFGSTAASPLFKALIYRGQMDYSF